MSTPPSSHGSSRGAPQRPSTPDQSRPTIARSGSASVAFKSEYLRNALQARRAQNTPTPSPLDVRPPPPSASKPPEIKTPRTTPDVFAEFALTEEQTTPVSPIRRRRPSDAGMPRSKTNRELTKEIEKLKENLMTSKLQVELFKEKNSELQQDLTEAKERVEELEPLEEENYELRDENKRLKLKVEDMEEETRRLRDANEDISAIAEESASHWQDQEYAIDEAAECIIKLEEEKGSLLAELQTLKERVTALEDSSRTSTLVDGSERYPSRVYSVDESRPSTSHFDSDYYSQPGSPHVQPSRGSIISITPSERSRKFLDLSEERRRSARDLVKRMSAASLRALSIRSPSPAPEVPQIPTAFRQQVPPIIEEGVLQATAKTPGRYRRGRQVVPQSSVDGAQSSPVHANTVIPQPPAPQSEGLRGLYRPDRTATCKTSSDSLPLSSHVAIPTNAASFASRQMSVADASPRVPSRGSSKHAPTNSSSEHLQYSSPHHQRQLESKTNSSNDTLRTASESLSSEWAPLAPPPPVSVLGEIDLTTELDPGEDKDRWWRSMDRLTLSQVVAQSQLASQHATPVQSYITSDVHSPPARPDETSTTTRPLRNEERRRSKTTPSTPSGYMEHRRDFLFNGAEDVDMFMRKTNMGGGGKKPL